MLVKAIYLRYGYDFREYQPSSIKKRFQHHVHENGHEHIADMISEVLHDKEYFQRLFLNMSVSVTEMFRNPTFYHSMRENLVPWLRTYSYLNIWHAGCSTGEEAYSMAIFLKEEGLLDRAQVYATDINDQSLQTALKGSFPLTELQRNIFNYNRAGCSGSLEDYYHASSEAVDMDQNLCNSITFSNHNLVIDGKFAEMHLIVCKNVLIYFNRELQNKVLELLTNSLCHNGFLCLGENESLDFMKVKDQYQLVDAKAKIYKKKISQYL